MARRSTYLAWLAPVALFLAAMVSADGKSNLLQPSAEPAVQVAESATRVAAPRAERVQMVSSACTDSQSCYDAQLKRLQAFY
jgi:hypothetical protein